MARLLILGAGYVGAAIAERALAAGHEVVLADSWLATERRQLDALADAGARVCTADNRDAAAHDALMDPCPDVVHLTAAQASRPLSQREPDLTEEIGVAGVRRAGEAVARAGAPALVFASSLHVYGPGLSGAVGPDTPYGEQGDLAHLSKVYGELVLRMQARRAGFGLALMRLGIVYGPGPVVHDRPDSVTVIDKFRRLAAAGEELPLDGGGRAAIGAVHLADAARILLEAVPAPGELVCANVAAETITVADVARLARGEAARGDAPCRFSSPYRYEHDVAGYLG
ncbi:MAG: NAD-dependent epimerase/dehydratase family protein [Solirubrobacteraceae bacterium]